MATIALIFGTLSVIAIAAGEVVYALLGLVPNLKVGLALVAAFGSVYIIVGTLCGFVRNEAIKLIQAQGMTRRLADRVAAVVFEIRDRALGGLVYAAACGVATAIDAFLVDHAVINDRVALSSAIGLSLSAVVALFWLVIKYREIDRFVHRFEQSKRSDEARKKALEEMRRMDVTTA